MARNTGPLMVIERRRYIKRDGRGVMVLHLYCGHTVTRRLHRAPMDQARCEVCAAEAGEPAGRV